MTNPSFSPQQVTEAIRAGLREGRQSFDLSATESEQRAAVYRSNLAHYREHVQKSLAEADYLQAAEKSWGAYTQVIKAIGADHHISITHHASIIGVAGHLAFLVAQSDKNSGSALNVGLAIARSMHTHFYENDLPDESVVASAETVVAAIDLLHELFPTNGSDPDA